METVDEDLFEPEAEAEPDEAAREAEADCEDDMIGCDRLSVDDQGKEVGVSCMVTERFSRLFWRWSEIGMWSLRS